MDFCAAFLVCGVKIMRIEYLLKIILVDDKKIKFYC